MQPTKDKPHHTHLRPPHPTLPNQSSPPNLLHYIETLHYFLHIPTCASPARMSSSASTKSAVAIQACARRYSALTLLLSISSTCGQDTNHSGCGHCIHKVHGRYSALALLLSISSTWGQGQQELRQ